MAKYEQIPPPKVWPGKVKSAVLMAISLATYAATVVRSRLATSSNPWLRFRAAMGRKNEEIALMKEEMRIKDEYLDQFPTAGRPHYRPDARMSILQLRARRGWNAEDTAKVFHLSKLTIQNWTQKLDDSTPDKFIEPVEPINKYPDYVRHIVQCLRALCPMMGRRKIADALALAGLRLAAATVARFVDSDPEPRPKRSRSKLPLDIKRNIRTVKATRPGQVMQVDLTTVPTNLGLWVPWLPRFIQRWPFCWWIAAAIDQYSRKSLGFAAYKRRPRSIMLRQFLGSIIGRIGLTPEFLICDKAREFNCRKFQDWCRRKGMKRRFGALGRCYSIPMIERFIKALKEEYLQTICVPLNRKGLMSDLNSYSYWFNEYRPHQSLAGITPEEVWAGQRAARNMVRFETRRQQPTEPGTVKVDYLELDVTYLDGKRALPVVRLKAG